MPRLLVTPDAANAVFYPHCARPFLRDRSQRSRPHFLRCLALCWQDKKGTELVASADANAASRASALAAACDQSAAGSGAKDGAAPAGGAALLQCAPAVTSAGTSSAGSLAGSSVSNLQKDWLVPPPSGDCVAQVPAWDVGA